MIELLHVWVRVLLCLLTFNVLFSVIVLSSSAVSEKAVLHEKNTNDIEYAISRDVPKSQFSQLNLQLCETNRWILFKDLFVPKWLWITRSRSFLKCFLTSVFWMFLSSEESDKFPSGQ